MTLEQWNQKAKGEGLGVDRKAQFTELRKTLEKRGLVEEIKGQWMVV